MTCPGLPIDRNSVSQLSAANWSPIELIGSVDLHFPFSGPSVKWDQNGKWALLGPVMQYWYPACAAVFQNLSTPIIMSASLLCTHLMQISYADMPGPLVTMENGKSFPFFHHSKVPNVNGHMQYPCWQLHGNFEPKTTHVSPNCPDVLLQADRQESRPEGPQFDQVGHLVRGDQMTPVMASFWRNGQTGH